MRIRSSVLALLLSITGALYAGIDFYSYYEKAEEARLAKSYVQALDYYRLAIELRPEPGHNVRTYGLNTLPTYYPYLGAALCACELEDYAGCRELLERATAYGVEPRGAIESLRKKLAAASRGGTSALAGSSPGVQPDAGGMPGELGSGLAAQTQRAATSNGGRSGLAQRVALHPAHGPLSIDSEPGGARVRVDGTERGETPLLLEDLSMGPHSVSVEREGYVSVSFDITLGSGGESRLVELTPIAGAPAGTLPTAAVTGGSASGPVVPQTQPSVPGVLWRLVAIGAAAFAVGAGAFGLLTRWRRRRGPATQPTFQIGSTSPPAFGDYTIVRLLGRGGMSDVYLAHDTKATRFALKILHPHLVETAAVRERFLREANLGRTLHHPNIVSVHGGGIVQNTPYIVMEYVEGETLKDHLSKVGRMPLPQALDITVKVASALDYAHLKGIIHRDMKPANIIVTPAKDVKVMDYGIARALTQESLTSAGTFMGTPAYMAPETTGGKGVDHRADLYSLGIILFELVTGRVPFVADSPFGVLMMHRVEPPPLLRSVDPTQPERLEAIISRLLEKDPEHRHPSAEFLINDLNEILATL